MKKGILTKLSLGVALVGAVALIQVSHANAAGELGDTTTQLEPAQTLIMPFDNSGTHKSFQIVSRIGGGNGNVVATHWAYWADDCHELADVFICLTSRDTVVVDPSAIQGEIQSPNPPQNNKLGPVINLTGARGMVVVTAYAATSGTSGLECIPDPTTIASDTIIGAWTIANSVSNAAFGNDAIGLDTGTGLPAADTFLDANPLFIQTFNPASLTDSEVILLTAEFSSTSGSDKFKGLEVGPISASGSPKVICDMAFTDNLEIRTSLPAFSFDCVGFAPIVAFPSTPATVTPLIPTTTAITSSGVLDFSNCEALVPADGDNPDALEPLGANDEQFIFAFHGQAVGPFGAMATGKYTGGLTL